ncbi:MAG: SRPBCC family protein [Pseudomonadota bacterium]
MPKLIVIERSCVIDAPIDKVWEVSATDFEQIDRWDANVKASRAEGTATAGAPIGGRVCDLYSGGQTVEVFTHYDPKNHTFAYAITKGLPGFVASAVNTWSHETVADRKTKLTMRIDIVVKGVLGTLMEAPMKGQLGSVLEKAQEELKHFAETGQPHPRKRKKQKRSR